MVKTARVKKESLREKLKLRHLEAQRRFEKKHPHAKKLLSEKGVELGKIRHHASRLLTAGTLGGALLLGPSQGDAKTIYIPRPVAQVLTEAGAALPEDARAWLSEKLRSFLPPITNRWDLPFLTPEEEKEIGKMIKRATGVPAVATLEGEHLNTVYGYTGYEQHLKRFPGDNISLHDEFREAGIAPGLGGFGYFTDGGELDEEAVLREKYYVVAQLMYLPDWDQRSKYLVPWYKWRKMIMVDVENGNAVVAVMGDAGPAAWTGKHFGASPEVMNELGGPRYRKGRVLLFFVDDPENKVPLGPVDFQKTETPVVKAV